MTQLSLAYLSSAIFKHPLFSPCDTTYIFQALVSLLVLSAHITLPLGLENSHFPSKSYLFEAILELSKFSSTFFCDCAIFCNITMISLVALYSIWFFTQWGSYIKLLKRKHEIIIFLLFPVLTTILAKYSNWF